MNLDYHILWVDDQFDELGGTEESLRNDIFSLGFRSRFEKVSTLDATREFDSIDLVLMDLNLEDGEKNGDDLIQMIRTNSRYTTIILYSADTHAELRKLMYDKSIDGIYCCSRDQLWYTAYGVIENGVRRVIDVNHMRGIVMSAVSHMDSLMVKCLDCLYGQYEESPRNTLLQSLKTEMDSYSTENSSKLSRMIEEGDYRGVLRQSNFGTYMKWTALKNESNKIEELEPSVIERLSLFNDEINAHRIALAHGELQQKQDGTWHVRGQEYTHETMKQLRQRIIEHTNNFMRLLQFVQRSTS